MMMRDFVIALGLKPDTTKRMNCPKCNGRGTFTASNLQGELVWNCYKAGCGIKGRDTTSLPATHIKRLLNPVAPKAMGPQPFDRPDYIVNQQPDTLLDWCDKWDVDIKDVLYDVRQHRAVFPITYKGLMVDAAGRAISQHRKPKWLRYASSGVPYTHGNGMVGVLVEDCISAYTVGRGNVIGISVLGTSLSEDHIRYLPILDRIVVCLDPDALPKTLKIANQLRTVVPDVKVLRTTDDLKYKHPSDLAALENMLWN